MRVAELIDYSPEVAEARAKGSPLVALESTSVLIGDRSLQDVFLELTRR